MGDYDAPNDLVKELGVKSRELSPKENIYLNDDFLNKEVLKHFEYLPSEVIVEAPASIANLGPGFDILGLAIEGFKDRVKVRVTRGKGNIVVKVRKGSVPGGKENVAYAVVTEAINDLGLNFLDFYIIIDKGVPPAAGLGSSGATSAAVAYGLVKALNLKAGLSDLIKLAGAGERLAAGVPHYDNVSASLLGGAVITDPESLRAYKIIISRKFWIGIINPLVPREANKTQAARALLPKEVSLGSTVKQLGAIAKLIHSLHTGDIRSLGEAISTDYLAEPARSPNVPNYWYLKRIAKEKGALGLNLCGAGPSFFFITERMNDAEKIGKEIVEELRHSGTNALLYVTQPTNQGVKVRCLSYGKAC